MQHHGLTQALDRVGDIFMDQQQVRELGEKVMQTAVEEQRQRHVEPPHALRKFTRVLSWIPVLLLPYFSGLILRELTSAPAAIGAVIAAAAIAVYLVYKKNFPAV